MYRVEVDWAPAYELLASVWAYTSKKERPMLELGADWLKSVSQQVRPELIAQLTALTGGRGHKGHHGHEAMDALGLLVRLCPAERDADGFLRWLDALPLGELYALLAPYTAPGLTPLPREVGAERDRLVSVLAAWNEQYFRHVDPAILSGLAADAAAKRALVNTMPPLEMVELATSGVVYQPEPAPAVVLLVPHYHSRPWNLFSCHYHDLRLVYYPADAVPPAPGEPSLGLLRLTRALADESRLRILHYLAGGPRSFTEVVEHTGLAKSTVHHHMVALRAASLVRVHEGGDTTSYSLRPRAVDELGARLGAFLQSE